LEASTHDKDDIVEELKSLKLNYQNILKAKNACENDLRQATQKILEQESVLQDVKADKNKMADDAEELNKSIETLQASVKQYQVHMEEATQKIQKLESEVALNEKLDSYSRELKSTVEKLQGSNEEYEELLESANKTILEQEAKIHVAQSVREDAMSMYHMKSALAEKLQIYIDECKEKL
jgi:chromosome segregation ATPase